MLAKKYRLSGEKRFKEIYRNSRYFFTPLFNIRYLKNNQESPRFAVVVSAKVSKKATQRNKIRRQLLEIIREGLPGFNNNYDYIIKVKKPLLEKDYSQIKKALIEAFKKTRLWF